MKVAYIVELDAYQSSGVLSKITSQVSVWNNLGAEAKLFLISKPPSYDANFSPTIKNDYSRVLHNSFFNFITKVTGKKQIYLNKIFTSLTVKKKIKEFNPDVIYYRWGIWFPGQLYRFGRFPLIVELNTNDLDEFKFYDKLTQTIHFSTRKWLLNKAKGFCSVTEEINKTIALKGVPNIVIGNGVDTTVIQQRTISNNQKTQLIFVGSSDSKWHGLDKIITLAEALPQYDFHIVGPWIKELYSTSNNIFFHGYLENERLSQLYKKIDIAIGTLALHRKKMEEASPLKVREYVAHGLPVIVGYKDTDLHGEPFILNIENYENNVVNNINQIVDFIETWENKAINIDLSRIDIHQKEQYRLDFFRRITRLMNDA